MKRFFVAASVLAALALAPAPVRAQTGTARGSIVDEKGQGLADVKVQVEYQGGITRKLETTTNKKGEFTQVGLQPGVYRFTANKDGYQGAYLEARIALGDPTYLPEMKLTKKGAAGAAGAAGGSLGEVKVAVEKAIELTKAGKLDEAEAAYKDLIAKYPQLAVLHHNLAIIYTSRKDIATAEAEFLKALEAQPDYAESYAALSNLYLATGKGDKAVELLSKAAADHADNARIQLNLGIVYFNLSKTDEAAAAVKKAASLDPSLGEVHFYLGNIAIQQGKTDECIAELEKYMASSPTNQQNIQTAQGLLAALKKK